MRPRWLGSAPFRPGREVLGAGRGRVAERSKARAWKVRIRQNRIVGSNPTPSANHSRDSWAEHVPLSRPANRAAGDVNNNGPELLE